MAPSPTTTPLVTKGTNFGDSQYSVLEVDQKGKDAMEKIPKPKGPSIWATSNSPGFGNVPGLPSNAENPALK